MFIWLERTESVSCLEYGDHDDEPAVASCRSLVETNLDAVGGLVEPCASVVVAGIAECCGYMNVFDVSAEV